MGVQLGFMGVQLGGKGHLGRFTGLRLRCGDWRAAAGGCHCASLMMKRRAAATAARPCARPGPGSPPSSFPQVTCLDRSGRPVLRPLFACGMRARPLASCGPGRGSLDMPSRPPPEGPMTFRPCSDARTDKTDLHAYDGDRPKLSHHTERPVRARKLRQRRWRCVTGAADRRRRDCRLCPCQLRAGASCA